MAKNHQFLYTLYPAPDHITSLYSDGTNNIDNITTSSTTLNMIKGHHSLQAMGWERIPESKLDKTWDGGRSWFLELMKQGSEIENLIQKSKHLGTFHSRVDALSYFTKCKNAFLENNKLHHSSSLISAFNEKKEIASIVNNQIISKEKIIAKESFDLKDLPIGTIATNSSNRFISLAREGDKLICFSDIENFPMTIKTKILNVFVEIQPQKIVSSIVEMPVNFYTFEQLQFIKKACAVWSKGDFKKLSPKVIYPDTIYEYLLT